MELEWLFFPSGKFPQACCSCGKTIPTNRPRYIVSRDTNPHPRKTAIIRHPGCRVALLYNSRGERVYDAPYRVVTEV